MSSLVLLAVISGVLEQGTQERQAGFFDPGLQHWSYTGLELKIFCFIRSRWISNQFVAVAIPSPLLQSFLFSAIQILLEYFEAAGQFDLLTITFTVLFTIDHNGVE